MSITLDDIMKELADLKAIVRAQAKAAQPKRFYTVQEVCDILRISRWTLDEMVNAGKLRKLKRGSKVLFFAQEVEAMIANEARTV